MVLLSSRFEHPEPTAHGKQRHPLRKVQHQPGHPLIRRSPYRPAASESAVHEGPKEDRTRSHANKGHKLLASWAATKEDGYSHEAATSFQLSPRQI